MSSSKSPQVSTLHPPPAAERLEAATTWGQATAHEAWRQRWSCLHEVEVVPPPVHPEAPEDTLRVGAWNLERCKHVEAAAALIRDQGVEVVLASEMDWGMARSAQRHTTRELAQALGWGYAFGVEFVELGMGDPREAEAFRGQMNEAGLHGNAILSRWPLESVQRVALDDGGLWYVTDPKQSAEYRVGGRMALVARMSTARGPLYVVSAHYESESTPSGRQEQTERLLEAVTREAKGAPVILGGDLNTNELRTPRVPDPALVAHPDRWEPCFRAFAHAGFTWREANTGQVTTRLHPHHPPDAPHYLLDWLLHRSCAVEHPVVTPAVGPDSLLISDHELIQATFRLAA